MMCPRTARGAQEVLRGCSGVTQGLLRGYSGVTHVCRRPREGPARRGRSCCHSGTRELPGSPSGCAGDTWHTAGPQGLICKIPAGRLQREGHRSEGCGWMSIIPQLRDVTSTKLTCALMWCTGNQHLQLGESPPSGNWVLWKLLLPQLHYCHPDTRSSLLHHRTWVCLLSRSCLQSSRCSCAFCPAPVCPQDREHCKDQTMQHCKSNGSYSKIPFTRQFTTQSSLHSDCHKHWLCPGSQKHLCGRFQKLNLHL